MHRIRVIAVLILLTSLALSVRAADLVPSNGKGNASSKVTGSNISTTSQVEHDHSEETGGLPKRAPLLYRGIGGDKKTGKVGPLAVTNSMLVMFVVWEVHLLSAPAKGVRVH